MASRRVLWASERLLGEAIEHAPIAFTVVDTTGVIVAVNRTACLLSGYGRDELVGCSAQELPFLAALEPIPDGGEGETVGSTGELIRRDGSLLRLEYRLGRSGDEAGFMLVGAWWPREAAELPSEPPAESPALAQAALRWMGVAFQHAPIPIVVIDDEGEYVAVNDAACQVSGYPRDELVELGPWELTVSPKEDPSADLTTRPGICGGQALIRCKDGALKNVAFEAATSTAEGRPVRIAVWWETTPV
jgi:PAS domain S-box-containing protein